jgi:hypothetical protein
VQFAAVALGTDAGKLAAPEVGEKAISSPEFIVAIGQFRLVG